MEDLVIKVRCWKCKTKYHLHIFQKDYMKNNDKVTKLVPCPYCDTDCAVKLSADQVAKVEVFRNGGEDILSSLDLKTLTGKSLFKQIFETYPPDK